jgi:hypothetical protein
MDSLTDKIRRLFGSRQNLNKTLVAIPTPCLAAKGNKKVSIKVFGDGNLFGAVFSTGGEETNLKQQLETFLDDLDKRANLDPVAVQILQAFSFEVTFIKRDSSAAERDGFGMMDFPVYLRTTASGTGSDEFTKEEGRKLLLAHRIPKKTVVMELSDDEGSAGFADFIPVDEVEAFIPNQQAFGIGVPGAYADVPNQTKCRKIGILKVNDLIRGVAGFAERQTRFLFVLKHELGHMFGLAHLDSTLMDRDYAEVVKHPDYTKGQIILISNALSALSP